MACVTLLFVFPQLRKDRQAEDFLRTPAGKTAGVT
jgi:hypothetical protein